MITFLSVYFNPNLAERVVIGFVSRTGGQANDQIFLSSQVNEIPGFRGGWLDLYLTLIGQLEVHEDIEGDKNLC